MSLLRLLTAGKSLVGVKDSERWYRPGHPGAMPKFGTGKNRFRSTTTVQTTAAMEPGRPASAAPPATAEASPLRAAAEPSPLAGSRQQTGGWLNRLKAKLGSRAARPAVPKRPAAQRLAGAPMQAELALDRVRVVRNDLSDADLEVVAVRRPATAKPPALAAPGRDGAPKREAAWGRVATLFRADKS